MAYQPIVRASGGAIYGYEALVRTAERSLPQPDALFDAAQRLGRIVQLGQAIRDSVAASMDAAAARGAVFVNVHSVELTDETPASRCSSPRWSSSTSGPDERPAS